MSLVQAASMVKVGGPFSLTASDGQTVTDQTYKGRWLLVYFGYTSCPDSCPTALFEIAAALKGLGSDSSELRPIFISVDPARDKLKAIGDYVQSFDARIVGLTGTSSEIDAVTQAYGAYFVSHKSERGTDYRIDHSAYIYLMNPRGEFVRAFDTNWSSTEMASSMRQAMARFRDQEQQYNDQVKR